MFAHDTFKLATTAAELLQKKHLKLATAESCTGGLVASVLTEIPGASEIFECSFVTYSNAAKISMLGVDPHLLSQCGAVSSEVALAMAQGALRHSEAQIAVAITGIAGPLGATPTKPVGFVHLAILRRGAQPVLEAHHFGNIGRTEVRQSTVQKALTLVIEYLIANG